MFRSLLAAVAALFFATTAAAEPVTLRFGNVAEPDTLDPHRYGLAYENQIMVDLFEGLMTLDARARPVPGAAERVEASEGGAVWTFHLREGLSWSDGAPLTADDFVAGARRALDPKTAGQLAANLYPIRNAQAVNTGALPPEALGVEAPDPRTVRFTMETPTPLMLQIATSPLLAPLPRHLYAAAGKEWTAPGTMVSNGAYTLAEWRPNDFVRIAKNPRYRDAANVAIDEVLYFPTDDDSAALRRFRAGELDLNGRFPQTQADWLRANMPASVRIAPADWINYIVLNTRDPKFADVRVRRALSMALDREAMTERLTRTGEVPAYQIVPPSIPGYAPKAGLDYRGTPLEARRGEAKRLLAEAGFGPENPLRFVFRHRAGDINRRIAVAAQAAWRDIGVSAELSQSDVKTHYQLLRAKDFEAADAGWSGDSDPDFFLRLALSDRTEINYGSWADPEFDRLAREASGIVDIPARYARYAEAEDIALRGHALVPLFFFSSRWLVAPHVKGFESNGPDLHPVRLMRVER